MASFVAANRAAGYDPGSEASRVVASSSRFEGWRYRITRELRSGWVDCSTLISQAHWEGAGVGIPFVAETQRLAYNAEEVDVEELSPADVLVRYPSLHEAGDPGHNHVVLYLGRHPDLGQWVIESARSVGGVRARPLSPEDWEGGVRRFLPFPRRSAPADRDALRLARSVPKLGRLGARLTSGIDPQRRHRGVDLYGRTEFRVHAPLSGTAIWRRDRRWPEAGTVLLLSGDERLAAVLHGVEPPRDPPLSVAAGELLGVCRNRSSSRCNSIGRLRGFPRLHVEFWTRRALPFHPERGLAPAASGPIAEIARDMHPFGAVYAIKLDIIGSPVPQADLPLLLTLPL